MGLIQYENVQKIHNAVATFSLPSLSTTCDCYVVIYIDNTAEINQVNH